MDYLSDFQQFCLEFLSKYFRSLCYSESMGPKSNGNT